MEAPIAIVDPTMSNTKIIAIMRSMFSSISELWNPGKLGFSLVRTVVFREEFLESRKPSATSRVTLSRIFDGRSCVE